MFSTRRGGLDAANGRRSFQAVACEAGLQAQEWAPRELRHSFVSLMSDAGMSLEEIARLVGHRGTVVTEAVNRKQLRRPHPGDRGDGPPVPAVRQDL